MIPEDLQRNQWHGGQLLAFSAIDGPTDYKNALVGRTSFDASGLDIKLPDHCTIRFPMPVHDVIVGSDFFALKTPKGSVRGAFLDTFHLYIEGPCEITSVSDGIAVRQGQTGTLVAAAVRLDSRLADIDAKEFEIVFASRTQWISSQELPSHLSPASRRTFCKALSVMKSQVYSPEGLINHRWTTPDRWPHRNMWLWDSVFHAIGWRHVDVQLARDAISAVLDSQTKGGFVAHMITPTELSEITQPPVLALGVKMVQSTAADPQWLEALYPKLCAYIEWDLANRDADGGGLLEWHIEGDPFCRSGESGMDNSSRFDAATHMDAVDFNAFLALECEILAEFAAELNLPADAAKWRNKRAEICQLIRDRLWSSEFDFFVDYDVERGTQSSVLASAGFLPLICGAATEVQAARLADHLSDPKMFGTAWPVASIAVRDREHYAKDMWRGPTWINLNWVIALGFDRYGYAELAASLRAKSRQLIEEGCEAYGTVFEFYDDRGEVPPPQLLRKGSCTPEISPYHQVFHDYGWTASLYVDLVHSGEQARWELSNRPPAAHLV